MVYECGHHLRQIFHFPFASNNPIHASTEFQGMPTVGFGEGRFEREDTGFEGGDGDGRGGRHNLIIWDPKGAGF